MNISEIREGLQQGDNKRIAKLTGYSENYISLVLNGKRRSRKILAVAERIIAERIEADKRIKDNA